MIGAMDQRITVKRETLNTDAYGGQTVSLSTLFNAWAQVSPGSGNEEDRHDRLAGEANYQFKIRNRRDFTIQEDDRIEWQGVDYNVRFVERVGGRELYLVINAERGVAQ